jgi:hypothetical protein
MRIASTAALEIASPAEARAVLKLKGRDRINLE